MNYFLYILRSEQRETYYTGSSDDPERRCCYHNNDNIRGYTRTNRPWELVYKHGFETKQKAMAAERKVKSWKSKKMIRLLVVGEIDIEDYLPD